MYSISSLIYSTISNLLSVLFSICLNFYVIIFSLLLVNTILHFPSVIRISFVYIIISFSLPILFIAYCFIIISFYNKNKRDC
jgi:ABC-type lipoprotein release transport system permease subunit